MLETAHLLRSPRNAARLLSALETDRRAARRLLDLLKAVLRDPFSGIGKPEPLEFLGSGVWSRRITQEHRCVYRVKADRFEFLQGRYQY